MKSHYPLTEWVHIFTDGAHNPGFGVHCQQDEHHPLPFGSSHFDAEFAALARAEEMVAEAPNLPLGRSKAVIFSPIAPPPSNLLPRRSTKEATAQNLTQEMSNQHWKEEDQKRIRQKLVQRRCHDAIYTANRVRRPAASP
jgi:hypothetical protein